MKAKDAEIAFIARRYDESEKSSAKDLLDQHDSRLKILVERSQLIDSQLLSALDRIRNLDTELRTEKQKNTAISNFSSILGINTDEMRARIGTVSQEITLRSVAGMIRQDDYSALRDFGPYRFEIYSCYLRMVELLWLDLESMRRLVSASPEWVLDFGILPLLVVANEPRLKERALRIAEMMADQTDGTIVEVEREFLEEAIDLSRRGEVFDLSLPISVGVKLADKRQRLRYLDAVASSSSDPGVIEEIEALKRKRFDAGSAKHASPPSSFLGKSQGT